MPVGRSSRLFWPVLGRDCPRFVVGGVFFSLLLFVIARHCSSQKKQMNWRSPGLLEPKCSMAAPDRKSHLSLKLSLRLPGRESQMGSPPVSRLGLAGPLAACLNVETALGQLNCHHKQITIGHEGDGLESPEVCMHANVHTISSISCGVLPIQSIFVDITCSF